MRTERQQARINELIRRMARRTAENAEDAAEIASLGCDCGAEPGQPHRETCPVQVAWDGSRAGLYEGVALPDSGADGQDVRHLTEPFREPCGAPSLRVTCTACGRYARDASSIRHKPGCPGEGRAEP